MMFDRESLFTTLNMIRQSSVSKPEPRISILLFVN